MLVSGLPKRNKDEHVVEIADCAMDLLSGVLKFKVPHKPNFKLRIRIGKLSYIIGPERHLLDILCAFFFLINNFYSYLSELLNIGFYL